MVEVQKLFNPEKFCLVYRYFCCANYQVRIVFSTFQYVLCVSQLQGMEQELLGAPSSFRSAMSSKVRLYHRDLGKLQRQLQTLDTGGFSSRPGDGGWGVYAAQNEQSVSAYIHHISLKRCDSSGLWYMILNWYPEATISNWDRLLFRLNRLYLFRF